MKSSLWLASVFALFSISTFANCVKGLDQSVIYCSGSQVYVSVLGGGGDIAGPVILSAVESYSRGVIKIEGTNHTFPVVPAVQVAVTNGCGSKSEICVGEIVTNYRDGMDYKIVGRFEDDLFAAALCLNDSCEKISIVGMGSPATLIRELEARDIRARK